MSVPPKKAAAVASKTSKPKLCTEEELKSLQEQVDLKSLEVLLKDSITRAKEGSHTCTLEHHLGCLCTVVCDTAHAPKQHCHL